ncbi:hypothetical protein ABIA33_000006 [Streptacidiphilus sp. MAP12-16]
MDPSNREAAVGPARGRGASAAAGDGPGTVRALARPEPGTEKTFEKLHAGLYALLLDDTCQLLTCDFDKGEWRGDAAAYYSACQAAGVPAVGSAKSVLAPDDDRHQPATS